MGDIDFEVIFATEIFSYKFRKTRFWKEKSVENVVIILEGLSFNSSMNELIILSSVPYEVLTGCPCAAGPLRLLCFFIVIF